MASSGYYYRQYVVYKNQEANLTGKKKELQTILDQFGKNPVNADPDDFNNKIGNALEYHAKALSGDMSFSSLYSELEAFKEKSVSQDSDLNAASFALNSEISSLSSQITTAKNNKDANWQKYQEALYAERIARDS